MTIDHVDSPTAWSDRRTMGEAHRPLDVRALCRSNSPLNPTAAFSAYGSRSQWLPNQRFRRRNNRQPEYSKMSPVNLPVEAIGASPGQEGAGLGRSLSARRPGRHNWSCQGCPSSASESSDPVELGEALSPVSGQRQVIPRSYAHPFPQAYPQPAVPSPATLSSAQAPFGSIDLPASNDERRGGAPSPGSKGPQRPQNSTKFPHRRWI